MELTQEHFDQVIKGLASKKDLAASKDQIIKRVDEAQEELALLIAETVANPFTKRFDELEDKLDVRDRLERDERVLKQLAMKVGLKLDW